MPIIGLDIGGTKMTAGIVDGGKVKKIASQPTKARGTIKEIVGQIFGLLKPLANYEAEAIGVGVPGLVDVERGVAYEAVNIPTWKKVELKKILEAEFKRPVYVNNDARCFVLGEKDFGKGKGYKNIAGVTLGTGMGTGLIIDGKLYNGAHGGAGEFGQARYLDGIMEQYSSGQFFLKKSGMNGDEAFELAKKRDKKALETYKEYGYHLGKALSLIIYAVDPEIVILGGSVAKALKYFEKTMKESLKESSYARTFERLKIVASNNENSALLGAGALVVEH